MTNGDGQPSRGGRKTGSSIRVVAPPPASKAPLAAAVVLVLALAGGGAWFVMKPSPAPSPIPAPTVVETASAPPAPDPAVAEARQQSLDIRKLLDSASDAMVKNPHAVKPPYPWKALPDRYRAVVRTVRGKSFERDFWLEHTRVVAVPIARLSAAVSADPDNPDAPLVMTVANENSRSKDYDATIRQVAGVARGPAPINQLMEVCFLLVSGDTKEATEKMNKLAPLPAGEENRQEEVCRLLARALLAYTVKKGTTPLEWARKGLEVTRDRDAGAAQSEWEWALILVYGSIPSLFHEDYGKRDGGQGVVDRGLALLGRVGERPPFFASLDPAMLSEVRRVIRDAGKRGMSILGPEAGASPPAAELALGAATARFMALATDPGKEEGQLWYSVYLNWLTPATPKFKAAADANVKTALGSFDAALAEKQKTEQTGVASACRARLAQIRGDAAAATALLAEARAKAEKAGYKEKDETVMEALDRLAVELKSK